MIYFDNAGTTKTLEQVNDIIRQYNEIEYYNPSAIYLDANTINSKIDGAKKSIINSLGGYSKSNLIFTSGATESNNMIINHFAKNKKDKLLFSNGEHPSIYEYAMNLKNQGYNIEFINIDEQGVVDIDDLKSKLDDSVTFVSVMHVSNETGAVNDIQQIVQVVKEYNSKICVHSDGVQAVGKINVDLIDLDVDYYTISAHKIYGPKGIGALYIKNNGYIKPLIIGGGQQSGYRAGTINSPLIMAFDYAVKQCTDNITNNLNHYNTLYKLFFELLDKQDVPYTKVIDNSISNIIAISFDKVKAETIVHMCQQQGVIIGNGSACSSKTEGNRILKNMNKQHLIQGSIRISFSIYNDEQQINKLVDALSQSVNMYKQNVRR